MKDTILREGEKLLDYKMRLLLYVNFKVRCAVFLNDRNVDTTKIPYFPPKHYSFSSMMIFNGGEGGMELTVLEAKNKFLRILLYFELPLLFKLNSKNKCT